MLVTFWGVRGSFPIARPDNTRYGGNSTCIEIQSSGEDPVILDGGSGLRVLGNALHSGPFVSGQGRASFLIGHTHWDHILGYPYFGPFYQAGNRFSFYSAGQVDADLPRILAGQHDELHFPVPFGALRARMVFEPIAPDEAFRIGGFNIRCCQLNHPGVTLGYRIERDGAAVVIFTDTARIAAVQQGAGMLECAKREGLAGFQQRFQAGLLRMVAGADLLVHDSHFREEEIKGKEHWGHSTALDALELARLGGVRRLMLFHHAPEHSDDVVDQKLAATRQAAADCGVEVMAAREGMAVDVSPRETGRAP